MPDLIKGKGTVVNILTALTQLVSPATLEYCAAKAALVRVGLLLPHISRASGAVYVCALHLSTHVECGLVVPCARCWLKVDLVSRVSIP